MHPHFPRLAQVLALWLALLLPFGIPPAQAADTGPRAAAWNSVEEAMNQGQPRTALERLQPILEAAQREQAWPEAAKAIARRIQLETTVEGRLPEERVIRYRDALTNAPAALQPVLHALAAHAWWSFFQQNRWRIQQRTAGVDDTDFRTWDLRRVFAEIRREYGLALTNAAALQRIPIAEWDTLIPRGTVPDRQRPTLFDFLSHEAIGFFATGEQAGAAPEDAFVLDPASPVFGTPDEFLDWRPNATDPDSGTLQATALLQGLLRFHRNDPEPSAFLDADLERLRFAGNAAAVAGRDARLEAALRAYLTRAGRHELGALARMDLARLLQRLDRLGEAHAVATETTRQFPGTPGAKLAANFLASIEARSLTLETERIWSAPHTPIGVAHRNVGQVWFRLVAADWDSFLDRRQPRPESMSPRQRAEYLRRPAVREWSAPLTPTNAWSTATTRVPPPEPPPAGFYFLFASARADFAETDNQLSATQIWVSDLALILRPREGRLEGFVLDAVTGEPVPTATVDAWHLDANRERVRVPSATTDALGFFTITPPRPSRGQLVRARIGNRQIATEQEIHTWERPVESTEGRQTLFFTDRALYRPGQLIQYKGICIQHRGDEPTYGLLPGQSVTVLFSDPNGREIARQTHRANDYGSFSGTFTAPRDGLTGGRMIHVQTGAVGATQVMVEEYKRPKFQVTLEAPGQPARLAAPVQVTGRATAYTGAAIDGAKVTWHVTRQVRLPPWCRWFHFGPMPNPGQSQAIAHGTATTRGDGSFDLTFQALPDPSVAESNEPTFTFAVHADVTDSAGETRSGERNVTVGYAALAVELTADEWQEQGRAVKLEVRTQSLDEAPLPGRGILRIHRVRQPDRILRHLPDGRRYTGAAGPDETDPNTWPLGDLVLERAVNTPAAEGRVSMDLDLPAGLYRATAEIADANGRLVTARLPVRVLDPKSPRLTLAVPQVVAAPTWEVLPEQEFRFVWGTGYEAGRAFVEIEHRNRLVERFWTEPGRTQQEIRRRVDRAHRGGFTLHVTQVRENRAYLVSRHIDVPWRDRELDLRWETFRSRLEPGVRETWTAVIKPRIAATNAGPAELVAALYDASLDQYLRHAWLDRFDFWPTHVSTASALFQNSDQLLQPFANGWKSSAEEVDLRHRAFPPDLVMDGFGRRMFRGGTLTGISARPASAAMAFSADAMSAGPVLMSKGMSAIEGNQERTTARYAMADMSAPAGGGSAPGAASTTPAPSPATITPRRNLQETAFFLPHAVADSNGVVRLSFTMPEALTEWRFLGFAHDRSLRSGSLAGRTVTARDLMVQPNPPRFLREGDELEFTVKLSNSSSNTLAGRARLGFTFALDDQPADTALGNRTPEQTFEVTAKASQTLRWRIQVPDGCGFLRFKATAATERTSDGEEGWLPVLPRRIHVAESLPVPIRGPGSREVVFQSLADSARSPGLRHESLTAEVVSQPAWYAVLALPYLMEFPHACSEQVFSRYYANAIAHHLANRDPKIRKVFDLWRATPALASPLERNPELKSVALEETPWLQAARDESESRQRIGLLFESDRLEAEQQRALRELTERQLPEGGWSWFPGGPRDDYITLTIVAGFGRLQRLGLKPDLQPATRALESIDGVMTRRHAQLVEAKRLDAINLDPYVALYLYARSLYTVPVADPHKPAFTYWLDQARQHWLKVPRQSQAHLALAFTRLGNRIQAEYLDLAGRIVESIKEHSVTDPELGRFWRDTEFQASWYRAPIETQALMIEAFAEVTRDAAAVEDCQVWLIKQKQTQAWKSTRATADAVHALLAGGPNLLASDALASLELGGQPIRPASPASVEAGTGYYQVRIPVERIDARMASITLRKPDAGVGWASVHWQYFQDVDQVKPFAGSPLRLAKTLQVRNRDRAGGKLTPVGGPVQVGDELVVRIELRTDRDLEYVHLKDQRPSGTEPVNVLSGYRFQDGLGYYESTRDTASHFFIGYLPKGTYVFEYPVRVQHRGRFPSGLATAQCLYAPEFNSHSASTSLEVR